jgi:hypothetical protein
MTVGTQQTCRYSSEVQKIFVAAELVSSGCTPLRRLLSSISTTSAPSRCPAEFSRVIVTVCRSGARVS